MNPRHHLSSSILLSYAAGAASDAEALMAATHLTFCASCRAEVAAQERYAGALLEGVSDAAMPDDLLAATLARLDEVPAADAPAGSGGDGAISRVGREQLLLPRALRDRVQSVGAAVELSFLAPGMKGLDLPTSTPGVRLRLMRLAPGLNVPAHDHGGSEYTLVLAGAFHDGESRRFGVGDLCVREKGEAHLQRVEKHGPCFALQLNEGPLLPLTWAGRVLSVLFDRPWSPRTDRL